MQGGIGFNTDLYDRASMQRLSAHMLNLLASMVEAPDAPLLSLSAMDGDEAVMVLEWNDTAQPYPVSATAHQMFEAQAAKTPDATALVFEGQEMSYGELMLCTSRLAARLQQCGAKAAPRETARDEQRGSSSEGRREKTASRAAVMLAARRRL